MNKKEKELSSDEALIEVFKASLNYFDKTDKLNIEFLNKRIEFIQSRIAFKEEEEPMKLFKKAHKKWEDELEELETELAEAYKTLNDEIVFQYDFYKKMKGNKKEPSKVS